MPIQVEMPKLSDTMEEGTLNKWVVKVGDKVSAGDHLADVETDKATMELQAFDDGTVARIVLDEGSTVPVGQTILILAEEGESVEDAAKTEVSEAPAKTESSDDESKEDEDAAPAEAASAAGDAPEAEPKAEAADTEPAKPDASADDASAEDKPADDAAADAKAEDDKKEG